MDVGADGEAWDARFAAENFKRLGVGGAGALDLSTAGREDFRDSRSTLSVIFQQVFQVVVEISDLLGVGAQPVCRLDGRLYEFYGGFVVLRYPDGYGEVVNAS